MTLEHETTVPQSGAANEQSRSAQVVDRAGEEASNVVETATEGVREVADEVKTQAQAVAGEARQQFDDLVGQARAEFRQQAEQRNEQAASQLRSLSEQLVALAEGRTESAGPLVGYLRDVDGQVRNLATRLEQRGPQGVVEDLSGFARRRPGVFLAGAVGIGFVIGRAARAGSTALQSSTTTGQPAPAVRPATVVGFAEERWRRWATVRRGSARGRGSEHGRFRRPSRRRVNRLRDDGTVRPGDAAEATRTLPRRPSR